MSSSRSSLPVSPVTWSSGTDLAPSASQSPGSCSRDKSNWSDQIVFLYLLLIVGTDKRLINDTSVRESIRRGLHYQLESFR